MITPTDQTTNEKIAGLLLEQTYAERLEMASSFRDVSWDRMSDEKAQGVDPMDALDADVFGQMFQLWAESVLADDEGPA